MNQQDALFSINLVQ